ncbi:DsrE family protein [Thiotrichales bacterium 19S9-12]|nr:DsrE family protein [Thiotrichales bacterium 19S9-11]MCF6811315.1 DsrE family protein [Thiotrichales bacterium 19S9-12]
MKTLTILIQSSPYQTYLSEIQDLILAQSAFFEDLKLIFSSDGILHLTKNQETNPKVEKNFIPIYQSFELYDIEKIYINQQDLEKFNLTADDLMIKPKLLENKEIIQLLANSDFVLNY